VIATPLGNLGDLSPRAAEVLRTVDTVAAEDTRRSRVLLEHIEARPKLMSFHAHSADSRLRALLEQLTAGKAVALLCDAGTPTISDPGASLVRGARSLGVKVIAVPGPTAVAAALSVSGFPADRFTFLGFLPRRGAERRRMLSMIAESPWTVVLFESAARLPQLLCDLSEACGEEREAAVARELTKVHEDVRTGTLTSLRDHYDEESPRGEVTVLVKGGAAAPVSVDPEVVRARALELLESGESRRDVAARVAAELNVSRKEAYTLVVTL
jgi:16S rRNA (cytidine1402-2'-O)-methyltransferase